MNPRHMYKATFSVFPFGCLIMQYLMHSHQTQFPSPKPDTSQSFAISENESNIPLIA